MPTSHTTRALGALLCWVSLTAPAWGQDVRLLDCAQVQFFGPACVPVASLPPTLQAVARALPLTYAVSLLRGIWHGEGWSAHVGDVTVLSVMFLAFTAISARVFRWEETHMTHSFDELSGLDLELIGMSFVPP